MEKEDINTIEKLKNSLLYELEEKDYDQIYIDYNNLNKLEFEFVVDANDILEYIDPFSILYDNGQIKNSDYKADLNYAFKSLLKLKDKKIYLLPEYKKELDVHKDLIAKVPMIHSKLLEENFKKEGIKNKEFIEQNASLILLIISGHSKTLNDVYKELFTENRIASFPKELYDGIFKDGEFSDDDKEKIKEIYEFFPKKNYPDFVDAVGIFRVFMLNKDAQKGKRYIYLSSAKKSKQVLNEIQKKLDDDDPKWMWLKKIIDSKHANERRLFLRNKQYIFGFFIYKYILDLKIKDKNVSSNEHKKNIIQHLINISLQDVSDLQDNKVYEIIAKKREELENLSVINNYNMLAFMDEHSKSSGSKYFDKLYENLKEYIENNEGPPKYDYLEEKVTVDILDRLKEFCSNNTLMFDRGKDKIISLFNSMPPLFLLNNMYDTAHVNDVYEGEIRALMLEVNEKNIIDVTKEGISNDRILEILKSTDYKKNYSNNLVFIFILIIIDYSFKYNEETVDHLISKLFENLKERIHKNEADYELALKDNKNLKNLVKKKTFSANIARELHILKLWTDRRKGANYSENILKEKDAEHIKLEKKYPNDYRFYFSHFLMYLNLFYAFKESIIEDGKVDFEKQNLLENYIKKMISIGEKSLDILKQVPGYNDDSILKETYRTLLNNISFVYCIQLDIILNSYSDAENNYNEDHAKLVDYKNKIRNNLDLRKETNPDIDWDILRDKHPVYYYTEAYGEYLEGVVDKNEHKLKHASKAIKNALKGIEKGHRSFFHKCCSLLNDIIENNKTLKNVAYESFIIKLKTDKKE